MHRWASVGVGVRSATQHHCGFFRLCVRAPICAFMSDVVNLEQQVSAASLAGQGKATRRKKSKTKRSHPTSSAGDEEEEAPAGKRLKSLAEFHEYLETEREDDARLDWDGEKVVPKEDMSNEHENIGAELVAQIRNYCFPDDDHDHEYGHPSAAGGVDLVGERPVGSRGATERFEVHRHPDAKYTPLSRSATRRDHLPTLVVEVTWTQKLADARSKIAREWFRAQHIQQNGTVQRVNAAMIVDLTPAREASRLRRAVAKRLDVWVYLREDNEDARTESQLEHDQHVVATTAQEARNSVVTIRRATLGAPAEAGDLQLRMDVWPDF